MVPDLIYDVGMNNGDDTAYYLRRGFRVVAIEANPALVERARQRFSRELETGRLTLLGVGVADGNGELPFWVCATHPEWSSFDRNYASREGSEHYQVAIPCRPFREVLEEFGVPFYVKIDIEGNDRLCLRDLIPDDLPKYLSTEASSPDQLRLLAGLGYTHFKCISQYNFLPIEHPPSPEQRRHERFLRWWQSTNPLIRAFREHGGREWLRRQVRRQRVLRGWTFPSGSSGPFGPDLPGRWLSCDELSAIYAACRRLHSAHEPSLFWNSKGHSFWSDFHALRGDEVATSTSRLSGARWSRSPFEPPPPT